MFINKIIDILSEYLEVDSSELDENTLLYLEYDLEDDDIDELIDLLNDEFDIIIDTDEFCELSTIGEINEYIENFY